MNGLTKYRFILLLGSILFVVAPRNIVAQEQIQLIATAPQVVELGEHFRVSYTVNAKGDEFNGPRTQDFQFTGPMLSTSQSTQFINGQVSQSSTYTYNYTMQGLKEGKFSLGPAEVKVQGKTYRSNSLEIEVIKGTANQQNQGNQQPAQTAGSTVSDNDLYVKVQVNRTNLYKGEQILATIKIYTRVNLARFGEIKLPNYSGFLNQEITTSEQITLQRENVNGTIYSVGVIKRSILIPQRSGTLIIEPFELECFVNVPRPQQRSAFGDPFFDNFFGGSQTVTKRLVSPPVTINVKELPPAPSGFKGAVGNLKIQTSADRTEVKTNEGINYKVIISGNGNIRLVELPEIPFPADFEVYDPKITDNTTAGENGITGTKVYEFLMIPRHAGQFKIPAWTFHYFNPSSGSYEALKSDPVEFNVLRREGDPNERWVSGPAREDIRFIGQDIRFIKTDYRSLKKRDRQFYNSTGFWFSYIVAVLLFILLIFLIQYRNRQLADPHGLNMRKALNNALKRIQKARKLARSGHPEESMEVLQRTIWSYLSDKLGIDPSELDWERIHHELTGLSVDEVPISRLNEAIKTCDFIRYAPGARSVEPGKLVEDAVKILKELDPMIKRR